MSDKAQTAVIATDNAPAVAAAKGLELTTLDELSQVVEGAKGAKVDEMKVGTVNLKTEYLSFENQGETVRRIFVGFTLKPSVDPTTGEEKGLLPAAQLYDPTTETIQICMQSVIVGVLNEHNYPKGAAIQITYKGEKKGKSGLKYQNFDIRALIP